MLDIAGSVIRAFPEGGPSGVTFLGFVDDLAAHYAASEIVISPLTFGSGLKIKFVEALANGKAVVATSITMQGVPQECEDAVRVSDDPAEFARHIVALHSDTVGRKTLAETALAMARAYYSANSCFAEFKAWLQESAAKAGRS